MRKWWVLTLVAVLVLTVAGYEVYQKRVVQGMGIAEQWASNQFRVVSEIPGVKARIGNRAELERYLRVLGLWNLFWVETESGRNEIIPKRVVIHLTHDEYKETWYVGQDGDYLYSGKAGVEADRETLHIYLGFNKEVFGNDTEKIGRAADTILFETVYARTRSKNYEQWAVELRDAKRETEPFFALSKAWGSE